MFDVAPATPVPTENRESLIEAAVAADTPEAPNNEGEANLKSPEDALTVPPAVPDAPVPEAESATAALQLVEEKVEEAVPVSEGDRKDGDHDLNTEETVPAPSEEGTPADESDAQEINTEETLPAPSEESAPVNESSVHKSSPVETKLEESEVKAEEPIATKPDSETNAQEPEVEQSAPETTDSAPEKEVKSDEPVEPFEQCSAPVEETESEDTLALTQPDVETTATTDPVVDSASAPVEKANKAEESTVQETAAPVGESEPVESVPESAEETPAPAVEEPEVEEPAVESASAPVEGTPAVEAQTPATDLQAADETSEAPVAPEPIAV